MPLRTLQNRSGHSREQIVSQWWNYNKIRHAAAGRHPDVVPAKAGNKFHYYWIPYRTSLARNCLICRVMTRPLNGGKKIVIMPCSVMVNVFFYISFNPIEHLIKYMTENEYIEMILQTNIIIK